MSFRSYVARRLVWTLLAVWLVLTASFLFVALLPDPNITMTRWGGGEEAAQAYIEARDYGEPLLNRYVDWVGSFLTFEFGDSARSGESARAMLADRLPVTLSYMVPAMVIAVLVGPLVGLFAAMRHGKIVDRLTTVATYLGMAVPAFLLGELVLLVVLLHLGDYPLAYVDEQPFHSPTNRKVLAMPMLVTAVNMLVVQVRYARAESLEYLPADFVKTLRASGASGLDVARHVFRNAAVPLVSLFLTEMLTVLFVTVYVVEYVFEVPGIGWMAIYAIKWQDPAAILASVFLPVYIALLGSFLQDVAYTWLDPRIDLGSEE